MKIIFDTNVLLSAFVTQGLSSRVLDICLDKHELYISQWIIDETTEKLEKKFHVKKKDIGKFIAFINSEFIIINPEGNLPDICRDKDDNNILHLAQFSKVDILITGDKDLLILESFHETKIINPRIFIEHFN